MADSESVNTLEWKHPDQIMKLYRLKMRKKALQARMNRTNVENTALLANNGNNELDKLSETLPASAGSKRKNPFAKTDREKKVKNVEPPELEASEDSTLFELLHIKSTKVTDTHITPSIPLSFAKVLTKLDKKHCDNIPESVILKGEKYIPIDWTLNTKMRIMSTKPFSWNGKFKASEEASGTTGFVRCLDIGENETTLDTSPNARFHRCCLVWQHPSLPWLQLFPRSAGKSSLNYSSSQAIINNQTMKDALYNEWSESFRSLFHLLRAKQCPYFYLCANSFTVIFRAAGICGLSEIHALMTPTTRGLRQALKQEEIEYTMPLRKDRKRHSDPTDSSLDETTESNTSNILLSNELEEFMNEEEEESDEKWLQSLGVEDSEIQKINNTQKRRKMEKENEVDSLKQSLVFVMGVEVQGLFNFLINCKSAISVTGALAGVPPTLLAPVAFHGATLKPLKVKESVIKVEKDKYYSLELTGPLLPHVLPSLCSLMKSSQLEQFTMSCAHLTSTTSFSMSKHGQERIESEKMGKLPQSVFGQENLSDCGFNQELLAHFCNPDPSRIQILESLKFSNDLYTWT